MTLKRLRQLGVGSIRLFTAKRLKEMKEPVVICRHADPVAVMVPYPLYLLWHEAIDKLRAEQPGETRHPQTLYRAFGGEPTTPLQSRFAELVRIFDSINADPDAVNAISVSVKDVKAIAQVLDWAAPSAVPNTVSFAVDVHLLVNELPPEHSTGRIATEIRTVIEAHVDALSSELPRKLQLPVAITLDVKP